MTPDAQRKAADLLRRHREQGARLDALPPEIRPQTRQDGYAIQSLIEFESREPLFGWKIAATSAAGQAHVQVDGPLVGRVLSESRLAPGEPYVLGRNHMRVAELEFAFRFRRDIFPRGSPWTVMEAMDEVETMHIAMEIPDSRFEHFDRVGAPQLIADNACAHRFLLGPAAPASWRTLDLAQHLVDGATDGAVTAKGSGRNVLGDPRIALAWFLDEQARYQATIRAGQIVTTGTCVQPMALRPETTVSGDFGVLGQIRLRIIS